MVNITPAIWLILFILEGDILSERIVIKTDGEIDLTIPKDFEEYDNNFDIYLHDTDTYVGNIWFDEGFDPEFTKYFGNIGYEIKEKYRGNNYAFKAVSLIKSIMLEDDVKVMLFSINKDNMASRHIAQKLGAKILCHRLPPKNHKLYNLGNEEIIIYKYDLEKKGKTK